MTHRGSIWEMRGQVTAVYPVVTARRRPSRRLLLALVWLGSTWATQDRWAAAWLDLLSQLGTALGYGLVFWIFSVAIRWRWPGRLLRGVVRLGWSILRLGGRGLRLAGQDRPWKRHPHQVLHVQSARGSRSVTVPCSALTFSVARGDIVAVRGWAWQGRVRAWGVRNTSTGQRWGWPV